MARKRGPKVLTVRPGVGGGTSRSIQRRLADSRYATRYFVGRGLDIGGGSDPLSLYFELFPRMTDLDIWDREQGDGQTLDGVADESYDFLYSSHCLEHLVDPLDALRNWLRVVRPGGHLIVVVPDEDLYEQGHWPSRFNVDHKHSFTTYKPDSWSPVSINLLELLTKLGPQAQILSVMTIDAGYRYKLEGIDQTLTPVAESSIEFILRKRMAEE